MDCYFGAYQKFDTLSKEEGAALLGADNIVGDFFEIVFKNEDNTHSAYLQNKFGVEVGFFNKEFSRKLSIFQARGWILKAVLSFVAFTDTATSGHYWGEVVVFCYDSAYKNEFERFTSLIADNIAQGIRPDVDLAKQGLDQIIKNQGQWMPSKRVPLPEKKKGTVIMKNQKKSFEKLVEQGRRGNKGCYFLSFLFFVVIIFIVGISIFLWHID